MFFSTLCAIITFEVQALQPQQGVSHICFRSDIFAAEFSGPTESLLDSESPLAPKDSPRSLMNKSMGFFNPMYAQAPGHT